MLAPYSEIARSKLASAKGACSALAWMSGNRSPKRSCNPRAVASCAAELSRPTAARRGGPARPRRNRYRSRARCCPGRSGRAAGPGPGPRGRPRYPSWARPPPNCANQPWHIPAPSYPTPSDYGAHDQASRPQPLASPWSVMSSTAYPRAWHPAGGMSAHSGSLQVAKPF